MDPRLRLDICWADLAAALASSNADARSLIAQSWPERKSVAFLSERTAYDAALQALVLSPGDEIVMSAVNIESMADIARAHGARLIPVDIDLGTLAPDSKDVLGAIGPRTRLVLIAHLYGARVDMSQYEAVKRSGVLLAEDCAQGWGGGYRGATCADISFFSFGPIKRRTALGGGVAVFADSSLAERCAAIEASYQQLSESWYLRRLAKFAALKMGSIPWVYGVIFAAVQALTGDAEHVIGAAARGFPPGDLLRRLRARPPRRMLRLLARRLQQDDDDARRMDAASAVLKALGASSSALGKNAPAHFYWLLGILLDDPDVMMLTLRHAGFDATRGTTSLRVIEEAGHPTPNARHMLDHVLYLPPPWEMSARRRNELIETLRPLTVACGVGGLAVGE
jgi:dTDP-4-amino-4,6-dideoxygalactose transaminase